MVQIVFEAGPTHNGFRGAKKLIGFSKKAGADAVKFQIVDPERLISDKNQTVTCEILTRFGTKTLTESLYKNLKRYALKHDEWRKLKAYADEIGIKFFATIAYEDEVDLCAEIGAHSLKICSGDVNHLPLIRYAARTGIEIQLDTGHSTLGEIERAVEAIEDENNQKIVIHQCPSGYPAHIESINLRIITTLKQMFPQYRVGFSDHTPGLIMDVAAVAVGADLLEKTVTLDKHFPASEHMMSLEPQEMTHFVQVIRDVETALGKPRRLMTDEERESRKRIRRSAFIGDSMLTRQQIENGGLGNVPLDKIVWRRPGTGVTPECI